MMAGSGVQVRNLSVRLPTGPQSEVLAVADVSLDISEGERVGLVGESGSGKSITGRAIAGLLPESRRVGVGGSVLVCGQELVGGSPEVLQQVRQRHVSMIFQDPLSFLNPTMRVGRQVAEVCRIEAGYDRAGVRRLVPHYLELAGLEDAERIARMYPFELSGGMRQRVLVAIALAKRPQLIIADEPTTALDVTVQAKVLGSLRDSVQRLGSSLLMITHDLAVVAAMCDRIVVLRHGQVVESGTTDQVFLQPRHPYTAELLANVRRLNRRHDTQVQRHDAS